MALVDLTRQQPIGPELHTCGNCGRQIGTLEQPYQWGDAVVCPECCSVLQGQEATNQPTHIARRRNAPPRGVSLTTLIGLLLVTAAALYLAAVLPLQLRLVATQKKLDELSATVNHNAEAANRNTDHVAANLTSLTETVNYNARVANMNNSR